VRRCSFFMYEGEETLPVRRTLNTTGLGLSLSSSTLTHQSLIFLLKKNKNRTRKAFTKKNRTKNAQSLSLVVSATTSTSLSFVFVVFVVVARLVTLFEPKPRSLQIGIRFNSDSYGKKAAFLCHTTARFKRTAST